MQLLEKLVEHPLNELSRLSILIYYSHIINKKHRLIIDDVSNSIELVILHINIKSYISLYCIDSIIKTMSF